MKPAHADGCPGVVAVAVSVDITEKRRKMTFRDPQTNARITFVTPNKALDDATSCRITDMAFAFPDLLGEALEHVYAQQNGGDDS